MLNPQKEEKIIFLHIPKNGGTTFNVFLNRLYPKDAVYQIRLKDNKTLTTQDFIELSEKERSKIQVLKGHMYYGLHEHMVGTSKYITFLRQPEKRLLSYYNFVKERPNHRLYDEIFGNNMTFPEFIKHIDTTDTNNAQVRYISGLKDADAKTMLETAKYNIDNHF